MMLYEFTVKVSFASLEKAINALNIVGVYQLYYEPPIEVIQVQNGYDFNEVPEETIDLKIYVEETEINDLPNSYYNLICKALQINKENIELQLIDNPVWDGSAFEDLDLGNGWIICYSGNVDKYPNQHIIEFEPQAAFGTGLHATTRDCLRFILEQDFNDKSVLDLGTGSGLLSIAAAVKGADKIVAVDFEPVKREVLHNLALNDRKTWLEVDQADLINGDYQISDCYDSIIINIGADETIKIINKHHLLEKSKHFIISGIVEWNKEEVIGLFANAGYSINKKAQSDEWLTLEFIMK